jgi:disulfide bond formation protein DsbB
MYPLVVLFGIAMVRRDTSVRIYAYPLAVVGLLIASYHYLIQWVPELGGDACSSVTPCTAALFRQFGFMSIPYMAGSAFALILVLLWAVSSHSRSDEPSLVAPTV